MGRHADLSKNRMTFIRRLGAVGNALPAPSPATVGQTVHDLSRNQHTWQGSWIPTAYVQHVRHHLPYPRASANFTQNTTYTDSYMFTVPYHCNIEFMTRFQWESPKYASGTDQAYSYINWSQTLDNANAQGDLIYSTGRNSTSGVGETDSDKMSIVAWSWFKDVTPGVHTVRLNYLWYGWSAGITSNGSINTGRSRIRMYPNGMLYNTVSNTAT